MRRDLGVNLRGALELSSLARTVDAASWANHGSPKSLISLARLAECYLRHSLMKPKKIQLANWEGELTNNMIECELLKTIYECVHLPTSEIQTQQMTRPLHYRSMMRSGKCALTKVFLVLCQLSSQRSGHRPLISGRRNSLHESFHSSKSRQSMFTMSRLGCNIYT